MKRKKPILLPGKELWSIHYEALAAGRMPKELKHRELNPLFTLATQRNWVTKEEAGKMLDQCINGNVDNVWHKAQLWISALNPKEEEDGQPIAGWLTLYNLKKYANFIRSLRPPYEGLKIDELGILQDKLIKAIEVEQIEKKSNEACKRHFLGIIICKLCKDNPEWKIREDGTMSESWTQLLKEMFGKEYYNQEINTKSKKPWVLTPSHGFIKQGKWLLPPENIVNHKIKELYKALLIDKYNNLEALRKIIEF